MKIHVKGKKRKNYKWVLCQINTLFLGSQDIRYGNVLEIVERGGPRCALGKNPTADSLWTFCRILEDSIMADRGNMAGFLS